MTNQNIYLKNSFLFKYQWIPSKKIPFALGTFKNRVDLEHTTSDDRLKKHSALVINKPILADGGNYTCNVQTFQGSDKATSEMQIIGKRLFSITYLRETYNIIFFTDPEDSIKLIYKIESNDSVSLQCSVNNIYPLPEVKLL